MDRPLGREQLESVAELFDVLSEPTRLEILQTLRTAQQCTVGELVGRLGAKQANVSKQLGILYDAGLVARSREGNAVWYSIREPMIFELCELVCGKLRRDAERQAAGFRTGTKRRRSPTSPD